MAMVGAPERPEAGESGMVPIWLNHLAGLSWRLVVVAILGLALYVIAAKLLVATASVLVAAIVAATFAPWVLGLRRRGWSRPRAAAAPRGARADDAGRAGWSAGRARPGAGQLRGALGGPAERDRPP